jgi:hypothetical protein
LIPNERERGRGHLLQHRPVAAMAGPQNSLESFGFPVPDHYSTRNQHQSNEKINANTSTRFRKTTMDRGWDAAREGGGAIAGSLELPKFTIQSTTNLKKSMGRERRRWRTHQNEEEMLNSTCKPRRRATANPRVSNLLRSVSRDLARDLDGKRDEGTHDYPFITPQQRFLTGDPGILGWFQLRWCSSPARSRREEEGRG